jgi:hypothetical protein
MPAHLTVLDFIALIIFGEKQNNEAPHYAVFFIPLSLPPSWVQIFPSALCSQTPSVYIPPLMSESKFNTHTKVQAKLQIYIF